MRKIIHVDMDAFYAAIEQRDRPELRGRPVIVGGRPDSRGVVCSASYEARAFGVSSAMGCFKAARLCPDAAFVEPDFPRYQAESKRIQAIFRDYTDLVEPLSLDEAYLDVTVNKVGETVATRIAETIRARIHAETGLTASAGVAPNKLAAKVASDRNKPDGLCVVHPSTVHAFIAGLPIESIPGIGPVTAARCRRLGIVVAADFLRHDEAELRRLFGSSADWFRSAAQGIDERPVRVGQERRSIGAEETFARDISDLAEACARLDAVAVRVAERLQRARCRTRTVTLKVRYADFNRITRSRSVSEPIDDAPTIGAIARELTAATAIGRTPVRLLGISCSHIDDTPRRQLRWNDGAADSL